MFPRKCTKITGKPEYNHYAIYVGPKKMRDVGQEGNDIFHRTGTCSKLNENLNIVLLKVYKKLN